MSIATTQYQDKDLTLFTWQGTVTLTDFMTATDENLRAPASLEIADLRNTAAIDITYQDLQQIRQTIQAALNRGVYPPGKSAVVVDKPDLLTMVEIFSAFADIWGIDREYRIFSDMAAACRWLDLPPSFIT